MDLMKRYVYLQLSPLKTILLGGLFSICPIWGWNTSYGAIHHGYATGQQDFATDTVAQFIQRLHAFDVLNTSTGFSPDASQARTDKSASAAGQVQPPASSVPPSGTFDWIGKRSLTFKESQQLLASFPSGCPICRNPNHGLNGCYATKMMYEVRKLTPDEQASRKASRQHGGDSSSGGRGGGRGGSGRGGSGRGAAPAANAATDEPPPAAGVPVPASVPPVTGDGHQATIESPNSYAELASDSDDSYFESSNDQPNSSNAKVTDYSASSCSFPTPTICLGSAPKHVLSGSASSSNASEVPAVVDSGATHIFVPYYKAFSSYKRLPPGSYVQVANDVRVHILGVSCAAFQLADKKVRFRRCYHVPALRAPLLSIRHIRRLPGCGFLADEQGILLHFPSNFHIDVDDSEDCVIPFQSLGTSISPVKLDYDEPPVQSDTCRDASYSGMKPLRGRKAFPPVPQAHDASLRPRGPRPISLLSASPPSELPASPDVPLDPLLKKYVHDDLDKVPPVCPCDTPDSKASLDLFAPHPSLSTKCLVADGSSPMATLLAHIPILSL
eukprot:scaffold91642_cov45-Attheya_sp.AAC.1